MPLYPEFFVRQAVSADRRARDHHDAGDLRRTASSGQSANPRASTPIGAGPPGTSCPSTPSFATSPTELLGVDGLALPRRRGLRPGRRRGGAAVHRPPRVQDHGLDRVGRAPGPFAPGDPCARLARSSSRCRSVRALRGLAVIVLAAHPRSRVERPASATPRRRDDRAARSRACLRRRTRPTRARAATRRSPTRSCAAPARDFATSVHRDERIGCVGCHKGDPRDPTVGAHSEGSGFQAASDARRGPRHLRRLPQRRGVHAPDQRAPPGRPARALQPQPARKAHGRGRPRRAELRGRATASTTSSPPRRRARP